MPMPCLTTDLGALFSADAFGETDGSVEWRGVVISGAIFFHLFTPLGVQVRNADGSLEGELFDGLGFVKSLDGFGVQPAGAVERGLRRAQDIGETRQSLRGQAQRIVVDAEVRLGGHRVDAGLAAHPARAGRGEIALDSGARGCDVIGEEDIDHIAGVRSVRAGAVAGRADVGGVMDHAFGDEEPGGELDVVAGGAHRDGQRSAVDADLQRFLGGDEVGTLGGEVPDPHARHTSSNGDVGHVLQYRPCRAVSVGRGGCAPARGRQGCHGAPGRTRTCGLPIRSRLLYPTELRRLTARGPWRVYPAEVMVPALTRLRA